MTPAIRTDAMESFIEFMDKLPLQTLTDELKQEIIDFLGDLE